MTEHRSPAEETVALEEELAHFKAEKEKIRKLVGQVGGSKAAHQEKLVTIVFALALIALFTFDVLSHFFNIKLAVPPVFSIEIAVLLVSLKIIWMIHSQQRVEHFQFWILNSIEFRLDQISKQLNSLAQAEMKNES